MGSQSTRYSSATSDTSGCKRGLLTEPIKNEGQLRGPIGRKQFHYTYHKFGTYGPVPTQAASVVGIKEKNKHEFIGILKGLSRQIWRYGTYYLTIQDI